ncbi:MAG: hypothetical protein E6J88_19185 [Deltaproteobacteria bacterium]|nr:MAG: hypothetical protein E6J88_19185 [Deltaproteobacteria bacterium]
MARKNGTGNGSHKSVQDARTDLLARAERNAEGAASCKTDPLGDAKAARAIVEAVREHAAEMARRGLPAPYGEAALELAREIEEHLQAMPAAAVAARGRTPESADLLADAAATAQAIRDGVLRLSRGADGRKTARDLGFGQPFSARQPAHVARALQRILDGLEAHKELREDLGVLPEDIQTMQDLARDLGKLPGTGAPMSDEQAALLQAQAALRAFFDLFAAKAALALAGDPDERARLLSLIPRTEDRRHLRRQSERASG